VALTTNLHLTPRLKSRAIPLLPFWAFVACSRVKFTFTFTLLLFPEGTRTAVWVPPLLKMFNSVYSGHAEHFLRLRAEGGVGLQICRVATNVLNKRLRHHTWIDSLDFSFKCGVWKRLHYQTLVRRCYRKKGPVTLAPYWRPKNIVSHRKNFGCPDGLVLGICWYLS
jgi:hypothetical protein